jgi:hypothetical protein
MSVYAGDVAEPIERSKPTMTDQSDLARRIEDAKDVKPDGAPLTPEPAEPSGARISQFERDFQGKDGTKDVVSDATGDNWSKRVGADHQMNIAYQLDGDVKAFEEPLHPTETGKMNNVDIVTGDDYAVECKTSWGDAASPSTVDKAYRQAETRFAPNTEGKAYKGVVVVFPDGKLSGEAAGVAQNRAATDSRVRLCETSQLNDVLAAMRSRKA